MFDIATSHAGIPQSVVCPHGQKAVVAGTDKPERYVAHFPLSACAACPERDRCLTRRCKGAPYRSLYFDAHSLEIARRRQRIARDRREGRNLRAAVASTIASLKRPFGSKLPVRGWFRMHGWMICAGFMINVRRLHRYRRQLAPKGAEPGALGNEGTPGVTLFSFVLRALAPKPARFRAGVSHLAALA